MGANLEVVNVTKNITFPAHIERKGNRLEANSSFEIDRRQWEMTYGKVNTLAENLIPGTANIEFYLVALIDEQQSF